MENSKMTDKRLFNNQLPRFNKRCEKTINTTTGKTYFFSGIIVAGMGLRFVCMQPVMDI